jgi:hypothetical protein
MSKQASQEADVSECIPLALPITGMPSFQAVTHEGSQNEAAHCLASLEFKRFHQTFCNNINASFCSANNTSEECLNARYL